MSSKGEMRMSAFFPPLLDKWLKLAVYYHNGCKLIFDQSANQLIIAALQSTLTWLVSSLERMGGGGGGVRAPHKEFQVRAGN